MKVNTMLGNILVVIGTAILLAACGQTGKSSAPTVNEVKAWRLAQENSAFHVAKSYELSDLSCVPGSQDEVDEANRAYAAMGMGDDAITAYFLCSYVINASFTATDKHKDVAKDYELKNYRVANEKFVFIRDREGYKWMGSVGRPKAAG